MNIGKNMNCCNSYFVWSKQLLKTSHKWKEYNVVVTLILYRVNNYDMNSNDNKTNNFLVFSN